MSLLFEFYTNESELYFISFHKQRENVAWSSTCNNTGQTAGWFIGNVLFLVVESADFSNKYFRPLLGLPKQEYGIVPIDSEEFLDLDQVFPRINIKYCFFNRVHAVLRCHVPIVHYFCDDIQNGEGVRPK
jgi:hypothetical protein